MSRLVQAAAPARQRAPPANPEAAAPLGYTGVRACRRIEEVPEAEWDSVVARDELQLRHAFVRACQDAGVADAEYRHLTVYREGMLVGIASVFRMDVRLELLCPGFLRSVIEAFRRWRPSFLRPTLLMCGLPVSAGRPCIAFRAPADAPFVIRAVAEYMEQASVELGARLLCFKEFRPEESELLSPLCEHGYFRACSLPAYRMALPWNSFADYVAGMRTGYRRQVTVTLRAGRRAGFRTRICPDPALEWEQFFPLYEQVMDRARFQLERLNLAFFRNLARYLPGATRMIAIERGDDLVAAAVLLETPGLTTFFMTGIDYERNRPGEAYPNLVTAVVEEAIRAGTGQLELGQTSGALKSRLGAKPEERFIYFRYRTRWAHALFRAAAPLLFPASPGEARRVFRTGGQPGRSVRAKSSPT